MHQREPHPRAHGPRLLVPRVQHPTVERHGVVLRRQPGPTVAHLQHGRQGEHDRATGGGHAQRVLHQAVDDLTQAPCIRLSYR